MSHIIAINASPSDDSNSKKMLKSFLNGVASDGQDHVIKEYFLQDMILAEHKPRLKSPLKNEIMYCEFLTDLEISNILIIATPTYNFSVPSKLKNLIDRLSAIALDKTSKNIFGQPTGQLPHLKTYFLVSGGTPQLIKRLAFPLFPDFWLQVIFWYFGAKRGGSLYVGSLSYKNHIKNKSKLLQKCFKGGASLIK